ncbi:MAG: hypothetical protein ACI9RO_000259 [Alteromonas macleodii]|jgi:hypothetical protein
MTPKTTILIRLPERIGHTNVRPIAVQQSSFGAAFNWATDRSVHVDGKRSLGLPSGRARCDPWMCCACSGCLNGCGTYLPPPPCRFEPMQPAPILAMESCSTARSLNTVPMIYATLELSLSKTVGHWHYYFLITIYMTSPTCIPTWPVRSARTLRYQ